MLPILIGIGLVVGLATLYFAIRSRELRKFLAGAFFVSCGTQFYLYVANQPVPLLGTDFVQTPRLSLIRGLIHLVFFALTFYFGFIAKPKQVRAEGG